MPHESLFDGRYRYDHIYPRGRSGEALRAYDTQQNDRQVVIKRPAPQDAPPIRAGQEVNIRTERRALLQLAGHPVLTALLAEGTFRIGGQTHLYIVMERAIGLILEDLVLGLAEHDERVPELEMLVMLDALLDLLETAHKHEIVYNDVDAKHLFWNRDAYQLKVIDWGNAVFLEGDEITPQGVSRQSDVYQVGELLYFVITGGQRLVFAGEEVDFGEDAERISSRLKSIVQHAVHPLPDRRYRTIGELRHDLAEYRRPLERDRAAVIDRVERRLQSKRSQHELERLLDDVKAVQRGDPGHPQTGALRRQIEAELHRLAVLSDLDAARIYLEGANWSRAIALLEQVVDQAAGPERGRALILLEAARLVQESGLRPPPAGVLPAIELLAAGEAVHAAHLLMVTPEARDHARVLQWLLTERIQAQNPDVVVLRPHLLKLSLDLVALAGRYELDHAQSVIEDTLAVLEFPASAQIALLMDGYQRAAHLMRDLAAELSQLGGGHGDGELAAPEASARRASEAAFAIVERLHTASAQATTEPHTSREALSAAMALDPVNLAFPSVERTLTDLQGLMARLSGYRPLTDGSDLAAWLESALRDLNPYVEAVPDPRLPMCVSRLQAARQAWGLYQQAAVTGNRQGAVGALQEAADAVRGLNPELAAWLVNVRGVVEKARYVQRYALNEPFGRAMADGWTAWDRGSGIETERLGRQALEEARSDAERAAADRLIRLGKLLRTWKEGHGEGDPELTARLDTELLTLLTEEEDRYWQTFTEQMPSASAYLNAMASGLIQHFEETSTAGQRVLFLHYVLRGVLEMYEQRIEDADFWRAAAEQSLPNARRHIAYMALTNVIRDRQAIAAIAGQVETIRTPEDVARVRHRVEASPLRLVLKPLAEVLRGIEHALPQWEKGDFRAVGQVLGEARARLDEGERLAHMSLPDFRDWLERRYEVAAELSVTLQRIAEAAESPQEAPDPHLDGWHRKLVDETELFLSAEYAGSFRTWRDTCADVLNVYTDESKRRTRKLHDLDEILNRPGLDGHPAYRLYRFWRDAIQAHPEFPAPPTDEPVPRYTDGGEPLSPRAPLPIVEVEGQPLPRLPLRLRLTRRRLMWGGALLVIGLLGLYGLSLLTGSGPGQVAVTWATGTPTLSAQEVAAATMAAIQTSMAAVSTSATPTLTLAPSATPTITPSPTDTPVPTLAPGENFLPTADIFLATYTPLPTATFTPTFMLTATPLPPPTTGLPTVTPLPLPPAATLVGPLRGRQNLLLALEQYARAYPWPETWFRPGDLSGGWLLGIREPGFGEGIIQVVLPADLMDQIFGEEAAVRLRRIEVTLSLREYEPSLIEEGRVYFGLGLQGADESRVAVQIQMVRQDAINIGARVGDQFRPRTTLPVTEVRVELALVRYDDGTVDLLFNGQPIDSPRFLTAPNAPVVPFLFVQQGGVVVSVTNLTAELE